MLRIAMKQLAIDLNCKEEDFLKDENTIVIYKKNKERRVFSQKNYFIYIACFGKGAVISADAQIYSWCKEFFKDKNGIDLFQHYYMKQMDEKLKEFNQQMCVVHEMYLPYRDSNLNIVIDGNIKWFEKDEIPSLYKDTRFKNAILYEQNPLRLDMLAVALYDKQNIVAIAGASEDSKSMWQIGIDVLPQYRQIGIGVYLVKLLTDEIKKRGIIPYYGTWGSNIASRTIAQKCGYFPAWTDMCSIDIWFC